MGNTKKAARKASGTRVSDAEYTREERKIILEYVEDELTVPMIKDFLREKGLPLGGKKSELIETVVEAIRMKQVTYVELIDLLDEVLPWGAQHVFLYGEPEIKDTSAYRDPKEFGKLLAANGASRSFRARLPLALPDTLALSSIVHDGSAIRIVAIERREGFLRDSFRDTRSKTERDEVIEFRAYVEKTTRGLIIFEWDLVQNHAMMQVTTLPTKGDYGHAATRFSKLVSKWLDLSRFPVLNLRRGIAAFHTEHVEKGEASRVTPHGVAYNTMAGGRVEARSATAKLPLSDDADAADAVERMRTEGIGRHGNFYWNVYPGCDDEEAQVGRGIHVKLLGEAQRSHFPTSNTEEVVRHVLSDIRAACH